MHGFYQYHHHSTQFAYLSHFCIQNEKIVEVLIFIQSYNSHYGDTLYASMNNTYDCENTESSQGK